MGTHKDLFVWQNSMQLVSDIYLITRDFPKREQFGITDQIRRAAVSIPVNISEGAARKLPGEFYQFLRISFGSLAEVETLLIIAFNLGYLPASSYEELHKQIFTITNQLNKLLQAIKQKRSQP